MIKAFYIVLTLFLGCSIDQTGCTNPSACNYSDTAISDDGSCYFAEEGFDCYGNCEDSAYDCMGECFGSAIIDGNGECCYPEDMCDYMCYYELDECGECGGSGIPDGACDCEGNIEDCFGECGGDAVIDECGECGGNGIAECACDCEGNIEDCFGECGGDAVIDECGECDGPGAVYECWNGSRVCNPFDCLDEPYFELSIDQTGESTLIIIQEVEGLNIGDEIGVFDMNGVLETVDFGETPEYGELLVGSAVYTGEQVEISAVLSIDLSDFGGPVLAGAVDTNPIVIKVFDVSENSEFETEITISTGGGFGDWFTVILELSKEPLIFPIYFSSPYDIYGFQFDVDNATILSASGGAAEDAGFLISINATSVLGFSLEGNFIPAGEGILIKLESYNDPCITDLNLDSDIGEALNYCINCQSITVID